MQPSLVVILTIAFVVLMSVFEQFTD